MTAEVLVRDLQRPVVDPDWEQMPPPPATSSRSRSDSLNRSRSTFSFTSADRASAAADLDSVIKILIDMMHLYPQWGKKQLAYKYFSLTCHSPCIFILSIRIDPYV